MAKPLRRNLSRISVKVIASLIQASITERNSSADSADSANSVLRVNSIISLLASPTTDIEPVKIPQHSIANLNPAETFLVMVDNVLTSEDFSKSASVAVL